MFNEACPKGRVRNIRGARASGPQRRGRRSCGLPNRRSGPPLTWSRIATSAWVAPSSVGAAGEAQQRRVAAGLHVDGEDRVLLHPHGVVLDAGVRRVRGEDVAPADGAGDDPRAAVPPGAAEGERGRADERERWRRRPGHTGGRQDGAARARSLATRARVRQTGGAPPRGGRGRAGLRREREVAWRPVAWASAAGGSRATRTRGAADRRCAGGSRGRICDDGSWDR